MDKSFNDDELADIMSEIENLEKEFADSASPSEEDSAVDHAEPEVDHTEPEVLAQLVEKPVEQVVLKTNLSEKVVPMKKPEHLSSHQHSSLSFKVEGQMSLSLAFEVNGQSVSLDISEAGLQIQMESGATFNLPMSQSGAAKKAA
jgi:hypothetical protein